jgi:DNA-directed RNA polymerase delta subunit
MAVTLRSKRPKPSGWCSIREINKGQRAMSVINNKAKDGKSARASVKNDDKSKKPPPKRSEEDDDVEDGDIATPKRDRDDEQQGL